jgi:peptide/nickel transport system ATP-binding protein
LAVVRYVASHVAVMYLGRIVEHGLTAEVLSNPQHPYTHDLLAAMPGTRLDEATIHLTANHTVNDTAPDTPSPSDDTPGAFGPSEFGPSELGSDESGRVENVDGGDKPTPEGQLLGATERLNEPADPHHPPTGCRYHQNCPVGPLVRGDREVCRTVEPSAEHRNHAACHFAAVPDLTADPPWSGRGEHNPTFPATRSPE